MRKYGGQRLPEGPISHKTCLVGDQKHNSIIKTVETRKSEQLFLTPLEKHCGEEESVFKPSIFHYLS